MSRLHEKLAPRVCAALLVLVAPALAQETANETRFFDVASLTRAPRGISMRLVLPLKAAWSMADEDALLERVHPPASIDTVLEWIRQTIDPEVWQEPHSMLQNHGELLGVRAPKATVSRIGDFLAFLQKCLLRAIDVEVFAVSTEQFVGASVGVLDESELAKLIERCHARLLFKDRLLQGVVARFSAGDAVSFVADYEVEVASGSRIADPDVRVVDSGFDFRIRADLAQSGLTYVRAVGRRANVATLRVFDPNATWVGKLQLPVVDSMVAAGSGLVADGGGVVFGSAQGSKDEVFIVRVRAEPEPGNSFGSLTVLPVGPLPLERLRNRNCHAGRLTRSGVSGSAADGAEDDEDSSPLLSIDAMVDVIRSGVDPGVWDEGQATLSYSNQHLYVTGTEEVRVKVQGFTARLTRSIVKNASLEFRVGTVEETRLAALASGTADLAEIAGVLETKVFATVIHGDEFLAVDGREQAFVKDHNVEIAQDSSIADPAVSTLFLGTVLRGMVSESAHGLALVGEFVTQEPVGEMVSFDGNATDVGLIETPRTAVTRARIACNLGNGKWTLVHLAPRIGQKAATVLLVRARF